MLYDYNVRYLSLSVVLLEAQGLRHTVILSSDWSEWYNMGSF